MPGKNKIATRNMIAILPTCCIFDVQKDHKYQSSPHLSFFVLFIYTLCNYIILVPLNWNYSFDQSTDRNSVIKIILVLNNIMDRPFRVLNKLGVKIGRKKKYERTNFL